MAQTAGDVMVQVLIDWGVEVVFGIPGDGVNGVMEALRKAQDKVRFVQVRHEEAAAFMACAYAKWTGRLGVCVSTSGPGGIHLLNGLYDAKLDGQPVVAITGMQYHDVCGTFSQQDVALDRVFADACVYNERIMGAAHAEAVTELACRSAMARNGPAHVTIANDTQSEPVKSDARSERNVAHHVGRRPAFGLTVPPEPAVAASAEILNAGSKVCILAGRGALGCEGLLGELSDVLAAPVAKALLGKAALPDDHPNCTGGVGLLGTAPSQEALAGCDTFLIVGSSFPYIEYYPKPGSARGVQIDHDAQRIGLRYPVELGVVGDVGESLRRLLPLLERKTDRSFLEATRKSMAHWRGVLEIRAALRETPMRGDVPAHVLGGLLEPDAIVTTDCGVNTAYAARHIPMRSGMMFSTSGTLASMGGGLPYAAAAKIAYPRRQVVAFVGDGGLTMLIGELATLKKYDLDVTVIVLKNNSLGQIKWEQMAFLGNPEYGCELEPIDFAAVARGFGIAGWAVSDPHAVEPALREALAHRGPALVEVTVDQNDPLLPPKIKSNQAIHLAEALARGTPGREKIIADASRDMVREIV